MLCRREDLPHWVKEGCHHDARLAAMREKGFRALLKHITSAQVSSGLNSRFGGSRKRCENPMGPRGPFRLNCEAGGIYKSMAQC